MSYDPLSEVVDAPIEIDETMVVKLHILRVVEKFTDLPGVNTLEERASLSGVLNDLLDRLIGGVQVNPRKLWVLAEFQHSLKLLEGQDTEGRDHFGTKLESIMDVLGIESSDGLLAAYLGGI